MPLACKKCHAVNDGPGATVNDPCPTCGAIYAKVDDVIGLQARLAAAEENKRRLATEQAATHAAATAAYAQQARDRAAAQRASADAAAVQATSLTACAACGTAISRAATACPKCGHPQVPYVKPAAPMSRGAYIALAIVFGIVVSGFAVNILFPTVPHADLPESERQFLAIVEYGQHEWGFASNSAEKDTLVAQRERGLCHLPFEVRDWKGTVQRVGRYLLKDGALSMDISVSPNITLRTEGDLDNRGTKFMEGTALYAQVGRLTVGQRITFSGSFLPGSTTCRDEASITDKGSMTAPDFIFKTTELK